jgi:transcriptional regulator with XRE-family HTH domain
VTGAELRAHRKAAGLSQIELARRAAVGRHAVQYWEAGAHVDPRGWAPKRLCEVLGLTPLPVFRHQYTRARGRGFTPRDDWPARFEGEVEAKLAALRARGGPRRPVPCGARTSKGQPCRLLSEAGRKRCKFHGGRSAGPRTDEGRARIAEAQKRRWAEWRDGGAQPMQTRTP